jgi:hypothetical protein
MGYEQKRGGVEWACRAQMLCGLAVFTVTILLLCRHGDLSACLKKKKRKRKRVGGKIAGGIGVPLPTDPYHDSSTEVKLLFFLLLLNSPAPLKSCFPDPVSISTYIINAAAISY